MPDAGTDGRQVDAEQTPGGTPALLVGRFEQDALVGRHREPGVLCDLVFELPGAPARIAERDQRRLRAAAARHGVEDVGRRRDLQARGNLPRVLPLPAGLVYDETAVGLYGPALQDR